MDINLFNGTHQISAFETAFDTHNGKSQIIRFILDGKTYKITASPTENYKVYFGSVEEDADGKVRHIFPPQTVIGRTIEEGEGRFEFIDAVTQKVVFRIGRDFISPYSFIWDPNNLSICMKINNIVKAHIAFLVSNSFEEYTEANNIEVIERTLLEGLHQIPIAEVQKDEIVKKTKELLSCFDRITIQ